MKTNAPDQFLSTRKEPMSRSRVSDDLRETVTGTADKVRSGASEAERGEGERTLNVGRAQDVYARTEQAASRSAEPVIETSAEAAELLTKVKGQVRDNAAQALQAQGSQVSAHLVELLEHEVAG